MADSDEQEPVHRDPIQNPYNNDEDEDWDVGKNLNQRKFKDEFLKLEKTGLADQIFQLDIPHFSENHPLDEISIEEESKWIYSQLNHQRLDKHDITNFLVLLNVQKLEIPFIAMYRKEQCRSLLEIDTDDDQKPETKWHKVLWMIKDLDRQWLLLQKSKNFLLGYYSKCFRANQFLFESLINSLKAAKTEREVDDVDSKFSLHFPPCELISADEGKSQYSICRKARLSEVAIEISCEPSVKKYVRGIYMENATVSISPTPHGNMAIDSFHQLSGIKWLREKPLSKFEGAQWLLIHKAEEDKLLQVSFKLPENYKNMLVSEHYASVSKYAQLWDEQRKLVVKEALDHFLLPSMEKEARFLLTSRAKTQLLSEYGQVLWNKVSAGPYPNYEMEMSTNAPRVLACCWGPGNPATTFVMLDSCGELLDVLYAGSISLRSQNVQDKQCLLKFMKDHKPGVVALGAANMSCDRLKGNIDRVMFEMAGEIFKEIPTWADKLSIVYVDESLPRLYENSLISGEQLPQQSGIERRAVAVGRYLQNPLAMVATLCGPGREILSWKLHPLENFLEPDEKYRMVKQVMADITNQVGIDINMAASHEWLFSPLQFISGLGLRKAASLQKSFIIAGSIFSRKDLINHGLGKKVLVNAAGFLRIRRSGLGASSKQSFDLLDDTRIHPDLYGLAQELAKDLRGDACLRKVDLDEYLKQKETYSNIIRELCCGFQDWPREYRMPSRDEELSMISGETICVGRIVKATVGRVMSGKAVCVLDCGLTGMLLKEDYSDDGIEIVDLSSRLCEGDILTCKIKLIQYRLPPLFLVCKESEMRKNSHLDPYYHEEGVQIEKEKEKDEFKFRMIVHPCFRNMTADQATNYLSDKEFGESIVCPSSRGLNYLTLTLKIYDNVYARKEIVERGKDNKDIASLGKILRIEEETFESLDGLMDLYVGPLVARLATVINHRKFRTGTKSQVDDLLRIEKAENPTKVVYGFGVSHQHPGTFILTYIRCINPRHEYIVLQKKGFKLRKRILPDLDRLVAYFKRHFNDRGVFY